MAKKWNKVKDRVAHGKKTGVVVQKVGTDEKRTFLNPHGKFGKATAELEAGKRLTNEGEVKRDKETGKELVLTEGQIAYRKGYRAAMIDQAKAYNAKKGKGKGGDF